MRLADSHSINKNKSEHNSATWMGNHLSSCLWCHGYGNFKQKISKVKAFIGFCGKTRSTKWLPVMGNKDTSILYSLTKPTIQPNFTMHSLFARHSMCKSCYSYSREPGTVLGTGNSVATGGYTVLEAGKVLLSEESHRVRCNKNSWVLWKHRTEGFK